MTGEFRRFKDAKRRNWHAAFAAVPLLLVNAVAFGGQLAFLRAHLPWPLAGQVTMAVALESVAVFLTMHAHVAALADDSALRLRLASYGFAAVIGAMNYSHYAARGLRPTFAAVAVGLMSASSPWLWAVHSRRVSRDLLRAAGLIEPRALRLGATRWLWHPLRSARVMWFATWAAETDPRQAIAAWDARRGSTRARAPVPAPGTATGGAPRARGASTARTRRRSVSRRGPVTGEDAEREFMAELASGTPVSKRQIRSRLHVGGTTADRLHEHLTGLVPLDGGNSLEPR